MLQEGQHDACSSNQTPSLEHDTQGAITLGEEKPLGVRKDRTIVRQPDEFIGDVQTIPDNIGGVPPP